MPPTVWLLFQLWTSVLTWSRSRLEWKLLVRLRKSPRPWRWLLLRRWRPKITDSNMVRISLWLLFKKCLKTKATCKRRKLLLPLRVHFSSPSLPIEVCAVPLTPTLSEKLRGLSWLTALDMVSSLLEKRDQVDFLDLSLNFSRTLLLPFRHPLTSQLLRLLLTKLVWLELATIKLLSSTISSRMLFLKLLEPNKCSQRLCS